MHLKTLVGYCYTYFGHFSRLVFDVELQGLHGVALHPRKDPELIPEANSDFVNRAQEAGLQG